MIDANKLLGKMTQLNIIVGAGPHRGEPVYHVGAALEDARAVVVLLHGRGATAESILTLAPYLYQEDVAFLAPQAANQTWYPYSFLVPLAQNEPYLSSALAVVDAVVQEIESRRVGSERIVLGGFSQGACLASEYAARNPRRYGGVIAFSGGLIGPPDNLPVHLGDLGGTPVFVGCSDLDPHIPLERVEETAQVFSDMNAQVDKRIYPGMDHTVNEEELALAQALIGQAARE